jgi:hypothetical protein
MDSNWYLSGTTSLVGCRKVAVIDWFWISELRLWRTKGVSSGRVDAKTQAVRILCDRYLCARCSPRNSIGKALTKQRLQV